MSLKKRIEILEREEEGLGEFLNWDVTVEIGKETRTFVRNSETGQESEDPEFIQRVQTWHNERNKRLGLFTDIVIVIGSPNTGQQVYKNGVLIKETIPETISGIETAEVITNGAMFLNIVEPSEKDLTT